MTGYDVKIGALCVAGRWYVTVQLGDEVRVLVPTFDTHTEAVIAGAQLAVTYRELLEAEGATIAPPCP